MKKLIVNWLLRHLLKTIVPDDILTASTLPNGQVIALFINGVKLEPGEVQSLKYEVQQYQKSRLNTLLLSTPQSQARTKMFEKSTSWEDMLVGKGILYGLDVQEKIISLILKAKV